MAVYELNRDANTDPDIEDIASLNPSAGDILYWVDASTRYDVTPSTSYGRGLLNLADAAALGASVATALVEDAIANGVTTVAPSQNAVYDALALKADASSLSSYLTTAAAASAYQPLDADLTSWAGVTRASGFDTFVATPSSSNLKSLVTDETGSGSLVFATSPTLVTPVLGVASATSINKVAITAPATGSTLTIANGKTLTASNTITFTATDGSTLAIGAGGTLGSAAYMTGPTGSIVGTSDSQTLSNKTISSPTLSGTVAGSPSFSGTPVFSAGMTVGGTISLTATTTRYIIWDAASGSDGAIIFTAGGASKWLVGKGATSGTDDYVWYSYAVGITARIYQATGGMTLGAPTGGDKGTGTLNAVGVYDDNTLLTDLVLDFAHTGQWDRKAYANHPIAAELEDWWFDPDAYSDYWRAERHLPGMRSWLDEANRPSTGEQITRLTAVVETQAVLIDNLNKRLKAAGL